MTRALDRPGHQLRVEHDVQRIDAEVVLERHDLARVVERVRRRMGATAVEVSDRRVHAVEGEDRDQLHPPIEDVPVGEHARAGESRPALHVTLWRSVAEELGRSTYGGFAITVVREFCGEEK
jgi:hypothetical protein